MDSTKRIVDRPSALLYILPPSGTGKMDNSAQPERLNDCPM